MRSTSLGITTFKGLWEFVNTEFISTSHGLEQTLKTRPVKFSMPRVFSAFPKTREVLNKHCT